MGGGKFGVILQGSAAVIPPSAKMASTLRLFTRSGREDSFSTTLVEDSFTRPLRALVDGGFLKMDYTGTRRIYTLTPEGRVYLEGKRMGRKKQETPMTAEPAREAAQANGHVQERPKARTRTRKPPAPPADPPAARAKLAGRRRAVGVNGASTARAIPARKPGTSPPLTPVEVIRLMREVRDYADAHEGVEELLAMIQRVEELGQRFGGVDCVRESLQAIREFRQEK